MFDWQSPLVRELLEGAPEGIVVCEANPASSPVTSSRLLWANAAFERMSGYTLAELAGRDLRTLQGDDREQEGRARLRQAMAARECGRALLRNYRKDGTQYWVELLVQPLRDAQGAVGHWAGFLRDVSARERGDDTRSMRMPTWVREDRLTGLASRQYFEELLLHDWRIAQRDQKPLTLVRFDMDALGGYNDTFGRSAGDACIKRISGVIASAFRRGSDLVARWEGGTIVVLARNTEPALAEAYATAVAQRVYAQRIRHPRARGEKLVTLSAGVAALSPTPGQEPELLLRASERALRRARQEAPGRVAMANESEFA
jgi:diguanylate cyclase (GGDEF)-like protein/PAS domain S-box-containing protein